MQDYRLEIIGAIPPRFLHEASNRLAFIAAFHQGVRI